MSTFKPTHRVITESDSQRTNDVRHCYKRGTLVQYVRHYGYHLAVVNANGVPQYVEKSDVEAL